MSRCTVATDLSELAIDLEKKNGIFCAKRKGNNNEISFPQEGHNSLFEIEEKSYWYLHRNDILVHLAKKYSGDGIFLDVGGGNGVVSKALQNEGFESIVIEPGEIGCLNSRQRGVEKIFFGEIDDISFHPDVEITSVGAFDVVEHVPNDLKILKEMNMKIKDGGFIYITVPAFNSLWSTADVVAGHFRRYTKKSISKVIEEAGFEVVESGYFFSFLFLPILLLKAIPTKLKLTRKNKNTTQRDHGTSNGILTKIAKKRLKVEARKLKKGKKKWLGSSIFVVAKKI